MHGPPEAEGSKREITLPLFVPANPDAAIRKETCPHRWDPPRLKWDRACYPTMEVCNRCGAILKILSAPAEVGDTWPMEPFVG